MKHQKAPRHMQVMQAKCKTCPFGEQGDKSVEMSVTSRLCRGARDWQLQVLYRLGLLPEPTDAAFEAVSKRLDEKGAE